MPVIFGRRNKRQLSINTIGVTEPQRKKVKKKGLGKLEKLKLQNTLASTNNPHTFANIFRAERINRRLGEMENNNNRNKNKKEEMDCDDEEPDIGPQKEKIDEILRKNQVDDINKLREAAAQASNDADGLIDNLSDTEKKTYEDMMKKYENNITAAAKELTVNSGNIKVRVIILKRLAEVNALAAVERINELEMVIKMKEKIKEKQARALEEGILAEEELKKVTSYG